jgi:hypothetical protein
MFNESLKSIVVHLRLRKSFCEFLLGHLVLLHGDGLGLDCCEQSSLGKSFLQLVVVAVRLPQILDADYQLNEV